MSEAEDTADEIEKNLAENSARELIQKALRLFWSTKVMIVISLLMQHQ
jgi:hypothetical protein